MNRIHTIALFAGVFAVAMGTLSFTGFSSVSAIPLMTEAIPQTQDQTGILGHVTYTLFNADGDIKSYVQADNVVVVVGKNCIASHIFNDAEDGAGENTCNGRTADFNFIAIGNATTPDATDADSQLDTDGGIGCATTAVAGEMARVQVTPSITNATTGPTVGAVVILETSGVGQTFTFDNSNNTIVRQSGIFDGPVTAQDVEGQCTTLGVPGNWNMFSIQDISVTTTDGDSLSIKWTITIG